MKLSTTPRPNTVNLEPLPDPNLERELMLDRIDHLTTEVRHLETLLQTERWANASRPPAFKRWNVRQYPWRFRAVGFVVRAIVLFSFGLVMTMLLEETLGWTDGVQGSIALAKDVAKPLGLVLLGSGLILVLGDTIAAPSRRKWSGTE
jgi:hypothetical protein